MYFSYQQFAGSFKFFAPRDLAVRAKGDPTALATAVRYAIADADPDQPVSRLEPMENLLAVELGPRRLQTNLLAGFAVLALVLASVGIYGLLTYSLGQRIPEMGLRMALGARPADIRRLIMLSGIRPAIVGLAIGLPGAWFLARLMRGMLYLVSPLEPTAFSAAALTLTAVACVASYLPARSAARIEPMAALRLE